MKKEFRQMIKKYLEYKKKMKFKIFEKKSSEPTHVQPIFSIKEFKKIEELRTQVRKIFSSFSEEKLKEFLYSPSALNEIMGDKLDEQERMELEKIINEILREKHKY